MKKIDQSVVLTNGQILDAVSSVKTVDEAKQCFIALIQNRVIHHRQSTEEAQEKTMVDTLWWLGHCDQETGQRCFELFKAAFPLLNWNEVR